ncbi:alkyl/aryl-sulfatase [Nocardia sp. NPDC058058]|uniref:alkyl/aryl-sulfatase n=1 Tax=Nocardia sp. NPDC058058 TaxID=3346317 RepID=UPI0036DF821F
MTERQHNRDDDARNDERDKGFALSRRGMFGFGAALVAAGAGIAACDSRSGDTALEAEAVTRTASEPSPDITRQQQVQARSLPFGDTADFAATDRGFIAAMKPDAVRDEHGNVVWDNDSYAFVSGKCPNSVHPSLWRQSQLTVKQGLYEVTPGIYQVRGLDLSNMTLIEGRTGVIVIDPLVSTQTAKAALELYRAHRGNRPVTGMIYTHSHADHFGGAMGVTSAEDVAAGRCPILAPTGFLEHAVSENIYAGTAMARRSAYMYGAALPRGDHGQVGAGLGMTVSTGTISLIPPTVDITHTGQQEIIDGVPIVFQLTPGTEAPSEMNFYFPDHRALCMAENATHTLHNILTLRGAVVRDPLIWSKYLTETVNLFGDKTDVAFASHHWPTWGGEEIVEWLALQRDSYAYLHDQTLRLLNQGYTGIEIAEVMRLPPALGEKWYNQGYYGTISHDVKAIYQRYMGWFDGNPAHLWEHPPVEGGKLHVAAIGGADQVLSHARKAFDAGDYRWTVQLLNYLIFAEPDNRSAKMLQASAFEQLGYGAENGTWRNFYLSGAYELRNGNFGTPTKANSPSLVAAMTVDQTFDVIAASIDGPRAWSARLTADWVITDEKRTHRIELRNGVLVHYDLVPGRQVRVPDATFTLTRPTLIAVLTGAEEMSAAVTAGKVAVSGDPGTLTRLTGLLDKPDPDFAIVTP